MPPKIPSRSPRALQRKLIALVVLSAVISSSLWLLAPTSRAQIARPSASPANSNSNSNQSASVVDREGYQFRSPGVSTDRWPAVRLDFSLERGDKTAFRELDVKDIEAQLNGQPLSLSDASLARNDKGTSILFMIDRSGSMEDTTWGSATKLGAAKEALKSIVSKMGANDEAAIYSFDSEQVADATPTSRKESLNYAIDNIRRSSDAYTNLYDAVERAINEAKGYNIRNVIVLSDGWEDTAEVKRMGQYEFDQFKRRREQEIARLSREKGVRVYTVAIGALGDKNVRGSVDYASLCGISNNSNGGTCKHVNLPKLRQQAVSDSDFKSLIAGEMKQTLEDLRKTFTYGYSLTVNFPRDTKRDDGELVLNFKLDNGRVKLPVTFPYTWETDSVAPIFKPPVTGAPVFLEVLATAVEPANLLLIYLILLLPLGLLSLVPSIYNRNQLRKEMQEMDRAILHVGRGSELLGRQCPNEMGEWGKRFAFKENDIVIVCPDCQTPHHLSCWDFNQHQCMNRLCEKQVRVPSRIMARYGIAEESKGAPV